ncbi:MCE family protein [Rhodococcus sp. (in: high G+C Gram-positive bacteria)]|uniref:MCE family protein n=1 Tax=Rhodococcus sp. TaxID=1831 RepID=UPI003BAE1C9B
MIHSIRPLAGLIFVSVVVLVIGLVLVMFSGGFTRSAALTVVSSRAGLVMNPDAKVKFRGVLVGRVASIDEHGGTTVLTLDMDPDKLPLIPSNTLVDIRSTTVFGAKFVDLIPPADPSPEHITAGTVLDSGNVTAEFNTLFQQLTDVLGKISPERLNETLGAIRTALDGRGNDVGQTLVDLDTVVSKLNEVTPELQHDLTAAASVTDTYARSVPDLLNVANNATAIGQTVVDERANLDGLLTGVIGLSDIGDRVLGNNGPALEGTLHELIPTVELTDEYNATLTCLLTGLAAFRDTAVENGSSVQFSVSFTWGSKPYEYPENLPKVAATGGDQCGLLPAVPRGHMAKYVVADVGANPFDHPNTAPIVSTESLAEILFGRNGVSFP